MQTFKGNIEKIKKNEWEKRRKECIKRDAGKCRKCGIKAKEIHHIIPRQKGGTNELKNLITLCKKHHAIADNTFFKYGITSMVRIWLKENEN